MKKLFLSVVTFVVLVAMLFLGLHVGSPCPTDAYDFASHVGPGGSNHLPEFGGIRGAADFLNKVHNGQIQIRVWGDAGRTIITATSSPVGPVVIIYGSQVLATMYTLSTDQINNLTRGLSQWTGQKDISQARNTAGCFAAALQPTTVSVPVGSWASPASITLGLFLLFGFGCLFIFILSKVGSRGGLTA